LGGALLATLADSAIRLMPPGPELKLGVVTALLGAPFFLRLVISSRSAAVSSGV
jgi:iron complex transport system permease protein